MEQTGLNNAQLHLLRMFAYNNSEEYANELLGVLTKYLQSKLDEETDRLWDAGILNQEKLDEIAKEDLHQWNREYKKMLQERRSSRIVNPSISNK